MEDFRFRKEGEGWGVEGTRAGVIFATSDP